MQKNSFMLPRLAVVLLGTVMAMHFGIASHAADPGKTFEAFIEYIGKDHILAQDQLFPLQLSSVSSETGKQKVGTLFYLPEDDIYLSHQNLMDVGHITLGRIFLEAGFVHRIEILEMHQ
ncbi:hypothetical protein C6366_04285 [Desulfonatronum sp. SC1]|nr:hypothetical protein C6366_04285 [Desulfonatronum sp. SC1]